jgi:prepilin-type processing-associated H-X9-DG protein
LVALLIPSLRGVWDRYNMTRCQTNLSHIYQAFRLRAADEAMGIKQAYAVAAWTAVLPPYLENDVSQLKCTETTGGGGVPLRSITEFVEFRTNGPVGFITQLEPGRYMLKLSVTQYNKACSMGFLNNDDSANNIDTKPEGNEFLTYVPDGKPNIYWLCLEDYGGDQDFKDAMTRVTCNEREGKVTLECISGFTGHKNELIDKITGEVIFGTGSNQWAFSPARTVTLDVGGVAMDASYGMNEYAVDKVDTDGKLICRGVGGAGGKILVMDYPFLVAKTTDLWTDKFFDPAKSGVPSFARHFGQANVLFSDGSVRPERPADINPIAPTAAMKWWMP